MAKQIDRAEFRAYFHKALAAATALAERQFGRVVPARKIVELLGLGGGRLAPDAAADALYVAPDRFYNVIDVGVQWIEGDTTVVFVTPAGFEPCPWEETMDPDGLGPFKPVGSMDIREPIWHRIVRGLPRFG